MQRGDRLGDACRAGLGLLGFFDPAHPLLAVSEGELVEERLRIGILSECRGEVCRHRDLARFVGWLWLVMINLLVQSVIEPARMRRIRTGSWLPISDVEGAGDPTGVIESHGLPVDTVSAMVAAGEITNAFMLAALCLWWERGPE